MVFGSRDSLTKSDYSHNHWNVRNLPKREHTPGERVIVGSRDQMESPEARLEREMSERFKENDFSLPNRGLVVIDKLGRVFFLTIAFPPYFLLYRLPKWTATVAFPQIRKWISNAVTKVVKKIEHQTTNIIMQCQRFLQAIPRQLRRIVNIESKNFSLMTFVKRPFTVVRQATKDRAKMVVQGLKKNVTQPIQNFVAKVQSGTAKRLVSFREMVKRTTKMIEAAVVNSVNNYAVVPIRQRVINPTKKKIDQVKTAIIKTTEQIRTMVSTHITLPIKNTRKKLSHFFTKSITHRISNRIASFQRAFERVRNVPMFVAANMKNLNFQNFIKASKFFLHIVWNGKEPFDEKKFGENVDENGSSTEKSIVSIAKKAAERVRKGVEFIQKTVAVSVVLPTVQIVQAAFAFFSVPSKEITSTTSPKHFMQRLTKRMQILGNMIQKSASLVISTAQGWSYQLKSSVERAIILPVIRFIKVVATTCNYRFKQWRYKLQLLAKKSINRAKAAVIAVADAARKTVYWIKILLIWIRILVKFWCRLLPQLANSIFRQPALKT